MTSDLTNVAKVNYIVTQFFHVHKYVANIIHTLMFRSGTKSHFLVRESAGTLTPCIGEDIKYKYHKMHKN